MQTPGLGSHVFGLETLPRVSKPHWFGLDWGVDLPGFVEGGEPPRVKQTLGSSRSEKVVIGIRPLPTRIKVVYGSGGGALFQFVL